LSGGLRQTTKNHSQHSLYLGQVLNRYEAEVPISEPPCSSHLRYESLYTEHMATLPQERGLCIRKEPGDCLSGFNRLWRKSGDCHCRLSPRPLFASHPIIRRYVVWHTESCSIQSVPGGTVSILGGHSIRHSKQCICTCVLFRMVSEIELFHCTVHCTDEQHAMSSHELQSALMLTVEFSKIVWQIPEKVDIVISTVTRETIASTVET
jgi:hypothetical protein